MVVVRRHATTLGGAAPLLLLLGACTGLVRSSAVYESKAGQMAKVVASAVETARLASDAAAGGKAYGRHLAQVLVEAEEDAAAAQGTFDGIQPLTDPKG